MTSIEKEINVTDQSKINHQQLQRIEESKQQILEGNFLTNEQADQLVNKWLNE